MRGLSIIIPTCGEDVERPGYSGLIDETLASIRKQELRPEDEVLIVADGPLPDIQKKVFELGHPYRYLEYVPDQ